MGAAGDVCWTLSDTPAESRRVCACRPMENLPPAAQKGRKGGRKKRVQLDVGPDHRPATQLDGQSIRALLKDRAPLLRPRQALAERSLAVQPVQGSAVDLVLVQPCSLMP